jgi:hypothetical protein
MTAPSVPRTFGIGMKYGSDASTSWYRLVT